MSYKGEIVAKAVDTLLQDSLAAAIAAIEAEWSADPIELNDIGTWHMGYRPVTLEQTKDQFPIITIMIGSSVPTGTADQFVLATSLYDVFINVDVVGPATTKQFRDSTIDIPDQDDIINIDDFIPAEVSK